MTTNIKALLNKKKWRGEEVGQALIMNLVNDYKMRAWPGHPPLFSETDLGSMIASLASDRDIKAYSTYEDLYNGLASQHNRNEAIRQQAQHGHYILIVYAQRAIQARKVEQEIKKLPVIMTEKQYKETMAKREAEKRAFPESFHGLIFHALSYYLGEYAEAKPKAPKPIKDALQALKKKPFNNKHILGLINKELNIGYQLFPNGKRSDQLTREERLAEFGAIGNSPVEVLDLIEKGEEGGERDQNLWIKNLKKQWERDGAEDEEWPKWVINPDPPEGLTCWDVLAGEYDMREVYSGASEGQEATFFKEFITDFPDLYKALREDIAGHKALKHLADTKPAQYFKEAITWGELADAGAYAYQEMIKPDIKEAYGQPEEKGNSLLLRMRARRNGVAILSPDSMDSSNIDENGYYKESAFGNIDGLRHDVEALGKNEAAKDHIRVAREQLLIPALREMAAYYALLTLIGERYKVPDLEEMKPDSTSILNRVDALNGLSLAIYDYECAYNNAYYYECDYDDADDLFRRHKERQALVKDLFPLIDLDAINPTEEDIEAVRKLLADRFAPVNLSDLSGLIERLMGVDEVDEGEAE